MRGLPNKIQADILKRHLGPFIFCFMTIMFLLLMQFLIQFIEHLVGKDIPFFVIVELILTNLAYMVVLAVPMAVLVSTLIAFGKFSENSEFTATKAAGIHPLRLIFPVIIIAGALSVFLMWFSNEVLPEANYKARALFMDIRMKKPGFDLRANEFYDGIEGYTFLVKEMPSGSDSLYNITLFQDAAQNRDRAVIKARRGYLTSHEDLMMLTLHLKEGSILRYISDRRGEDTLLEETKFGKYRISFDLSDLAFTRTNPERRRRDGRTMSAQAMLAVVDTISGEINHEVVKFRNSVHFMNLLIPQEQTVIESISDTSMYPRDMYELDVPMEATQATEYLTSNPPEPSRFYTLNTLSSLEEQRDISRNGMMGFRNTLSHFDNLKTSLRWRTERIASFMVEVHKKVSIPFACIVFALVGAPLGMLTRKGNLGVNALIGTILFTFYWISIIQGEKMADRLFISPFMGMWFANIVLLIVGFFLILKVSREHNFLRLPKP